MQLNYRGITYDYRPPIVEMEPSETVGLVKGLEWRFRNRKKLPILQTTLDLKYRDTAQHNGSSDAANAVPLSQSNAETSTYKDAPVADLARALLIEHHGLIQKREQSMLGRVASEVGLGVAAAHYWLPIQGKSWSGIRHTYDRSAVAMS